LDVFVNSSDIKGILSALHSIREKAQKDGQKKSEETIGRYLSEFIYSISSAILWKFVKSIHGPCRLKLDLYLN
jgi:hypothetical protein